MPRYRLTEELWFKLRETLLQFSLYNKAGLRRTVEGILFKMRTGVPWRDLPENIGKSRAGDTSKVHLAVNAYGLPEAFTMTGGRFYQTNVTDFH